MNTPVKIVCNIHKRVKAMTQFAAKRKLRVKKMRWKFNEMLILTQPKIIA